MICPCCEEEYDGICRLMERAFSNLLAGQMKAINGSASTGEHVVIHAGWIEGGLCEKDHRHDD